MRQVRAQPLLPVRMDDTYRRQLQDILNEFAAALIQVANLQLTEFVSISAAYTAGVNDHLILASPSGAFTITLPSASDMRNKRVIVKRANNTTHTITVQSSSGNIDGAASTTLTTAYQSKEFASDGANWWSV